MEHNKTRLHNNDVKNPFIIMTKQMTQWRLQGNQVTCAVRISLAFSYHLIAHEYDFC